jgi:hypothetical protein
VEKNMTPAQDSLSSPTINIPEAPQLTAYALNHYRKMPLVPASSDRPWMKAADQHFPNRCLPLLIANQSGWFLLNTHKIRVTWIGWNDIESLQVEMLSGEPPCLAISHFGHGILTWTVPYLFRTPPGYNLLVRGPANWPKDGIYPLEGVVETDWSEATFTMNWKMTRPVQRVIFDEGEPIALLVPQRRGELETFQPEIRAIEDVPELHQGYQQWSQSRDSFNAGLRQPGSKEVKQGWQKHYFQGVHLTKTPGPEHQTKLKLRDFVDRRSKTDSTERSPCGRGRGRT